MSELVERECEDYHKMNPDPFDDRHPGMMHEWYDDDSDDNGGNRWKWWCYNNDDYFMMIMSKVQAQITKGSNDGY